MEFNLENPIANSHESSLFLAESDHTPSLTSLHLSPIRAKVISLILQFCSKFDPFLSYLSINYLDRFLSTQDILEDKPWIFRLLAVSCVSLAMKMRDAEFSVSDIQVQYDGGLVYDFESIERMELMILGVVKWRMRSITAFAFINLFISLFKFPSTQQALKARATEIILTSQIHVKLIEFRPSIISAAALLSASHQLFPLQFPCYKTAFFNCSFLNKENFWRCYNIVQEIAMLEILVCSSSTSTPGNVPAASSPTNDVESQNPPTHKIEVNPNGILRLENDFKRRKINVFTSISPLPADQPAVLNC